MTITLQIGHWMAPIAFVIAGTLWLCWAAAKDGKAAELVPSILTMGVCIVALMLLTRFLP